MEPKYSGELRCQFGGKGKFETVWVELTHTQQLNFKLPPSTKSLLLDFHMDKSIFSKLSARLSKPTGQLLIFSSFSSFLLSSFSASLAPYRNLDVLDLGRLGC